MKGQLIKTDGTEEQIEFNGIPGASKAINADTLDTVNLRDGKVMLVDDIGLKKGLPVNAKATEIYHGICRPGTTHQIVGDVVIALDADFGPPY